MKFKYSFYENLSTARFCDELSKMGITVLGTPMISHGTFLFITDCGTPEQIMAAKMAAKW